MGRYGVFHELAAPSCNLFAKTASLHCRPAVTRAPQPGLGNPCPAAEASHPERYDSSMTQKIAVSLPDEQVSSIRRAVAQGRAASVSGYISAAVARAEREDGLTELLDDLDRELGPVDDADLAWADRALGLA